MCIRDSVKTSEVVQVAVEGVEQLEIYFGSYLPQFFYSMLAPITLFSALCFVNILIAICLLICVPLIPVAIAAVQTWAKKLLSKYWGQYTVLGDTFLENLQGLTTLKIYKADSFKMCIRDRNYADPETGVRVSADKGVFEEGVQIVINEITSGADYDQAASSLNEVGKKFKLYNIEFLDADGNKVDANGVVTIKFPITAGYDADSLAVYRMDDGNKILMRGDVEDNY